jgi:hypothetical protein
VTEHKFGTWYPIEELEEEYCPALLLLRDLSQEVGSVKTWDHFDGSSKIQYADRVGLTLDPVSWMPLPPSPGEE